MANVDFDAAQLQWRRGGSLANPSWAPRTGGPPGSTATTPWSQRRPKGRRRRCQQRTGTGWRCASAATLRCSGRCASGGLPKQTTRLSFLLPNRPQNQPPLPPKKKGAAPTAHEIAKRRDALAGSLPPSSQGWPCPPRCLHWSLPPSHPTLHTHAASESSRQCASAPIRWTVAQGEGEKSGVAGEATVFPIACTTRPRVGPRAWGRPRPGRRESERAE